MDLRQRLQLVVDATTGKADAEFRKLTGTTKDLGTAAKRSADDVRAAANRVAEARERERVAAGQLQVAERRLQELRDSGRAKASQLLAAEEKAAAAQRGLQRAVAGTERALREQQDAVQDSARSMDDAADSGGLLANVTGRAKAGLAGLAGAGIGAGLRGIADGFAEGARSAQLFANSTNSSVEQAGQFLGLVGALGLDLNDLLEIQAEYAQKAAASAGDLEKLGAELQRNSDGTVNWTESLVTFLDQLQGVEDATERNRLGFQFLGEEGYKQLSQLVASGVDVREALERIGTPFSQEDVDAAADYNAAMLDLSLTGTRTSQALGRVLVPAITAVLEGIGDTVEVAEDLGPVLIGTTAAAIALGITGFSPTAAAGARLVVVQGLLNRNVALFRATAGLAGRSAATLGASYGIAAAGARGLLGIVGGPLGVALIGLGTIYTLASNGADDFRESARKAAVELDKQPEAMERTGRSVQQLARELAEQAGAWERAAAAARGTQETGMTDWFGLGATAGLLGDTTQATAGFSAQIEDARRELGEFGAQQEFAQESTRALNDLIAQGATSGAEFAAAVGIAADAQAQQERTSGLAQAAIDAYNATTRDAVEATLALLDAQLAQSDGLIGLQQEIYNAADVVDDLKTPWNEVEEATNKVIGRTLDYASTAADAAVAAAKANGTVVDAVAEAQIRARASINGLKEALDQPGLTAGARKRIRGMIEDLREARDAGDIEAILRLTGDRETTSTLDKTTKDRETHVRVESRNGPAVDAYLDRLASQTRVAYIDVRERSSGAGAGGGSAPGAPAMLRGAPSVAGGYGSGGVNVGQLTMIVQADATGRVSRQSLAEAGRQAVQQIAAYERLNGPGWRQGGRR